MSESDLLVSKPIVQDIYLVSRTKYLENEKGATPKEIKDELTEYEGNEIMKSIGQMEMHGILYGYGNVYRPEKRSEWAYLLEKLLKLDPNEVGIEQQARK